MHQSSRVWWPIGFVLLGIWVAVTALLCRSSMERGAAGLSEWMERGLLLLGPYLISAVALSLTRSPELRKSLAKSGLFFVLLPGQFAVGMYVAGLAKYPRIYYVTDVFYLMGCSLILLEMYGFSLVLIVAILVTQQNRELRRVGTAHHEPTMS